MSEEQAKGVPPVVRQDGGSPKELLSEPRALPVARLADSESTRLEVNGSRALAGCRWSLFGKRSDFLRASNWPGALSRSPGTRALCIRIPEVPRIVTELDCHGCKLWEPADKRES